MLTAWGVKGWMRGGRTGSGGVLARREVSDMAVRWMKSSADDGRARNVHGYDAVDEFNAELEQVFGAAPASFNLPGGML